MRPRAFGAVKSIEYLFQGYICYQIGEEQKLKGNNRAQKRDWGNEGEIKSASKKVGITNKMRILRKYTSLVSTKNIPEPYWKTFLWIHYADTDTQVCIARILTVVIGIRIRILDPFLIEHTICGYVKVQGSGKKNLRSGSVYTILQLKWHKSWKCAHRAWLHLLYF